jgi:hypothetical protein
MIAPNVDVNVTHSMFLEHDRAEPRTVFVARTLTLSQSQRLAERMATLERHVRMAAEYKRLRDVSQVKYEGPEAAGDKPHVPRPELVRAMYDAEADSVREGMAALVLACELFELLIVDVHNTPAAVKKVNGEFGTGVARDWAMEALARNYGGEAVVELVMSAINANRLTESQRKNLCAQSGLASMPPDLTAQPAMTQNVHVAGVSPAAACGTPSMAAAI